MGKIVEGRSFDVASHPGDRVMLVSVVAERNMGQVIGIFSALTERNDEIKGEVWLPGNATWDTIKSAIARDLRWHGGRIEWVQ